MEKHDCNRSNTLGLQERMLLLRITGPQERLDYPTETLRMSNGCDVERYIIPDEDRQKVLDALYPFIGRPSLEDTLIDIQTQRTFKVRDFIVTREGDGNFLVSPYYAEKGGTVLDWMAPDNDGSCKNLKGNPIISVGIVRG